ncbi:MAG: M1 family metallopeptidase [Flavisolibacter sp.]
MKKVFLFFASAGVFASVNAQSIQNNPGSNHGNKFEQLGTILPTPNQYRSASGAPGPKYWQQRCDYDIKATLDEKALKLTGSETVTYYNNSPDVLTYLWLQLDENEHSTVDNANYQTSNTMPKNAVLSQLERMDNGKADNGYGHKITKLTDATGKALKYTINKTMMRIELPQALKPGQKFIFKCDWYYNIPDRMTLGGRGGYEYFAEDGNHIFTIAQWYPRLCVYTDYTGWQNKQFTGRGEFALTFGNFKVQMTVPADHVVGSTGECLNYAQTLTATQQARWRQAQTAKDVVEIVTLAEAKNAETKKSKATKTWIYKAENVRDFAWTSSRKFVMDAMPVTVEGKKIMCMSFYGKEAYNLWRRYSTKVVAHTIKTYSKYSIPYPYPTAQSVEASSGMEYPMICFNNGRTNRDGSYSEQTKYAMIGVITHEVGHNFFPMIINSDERQWSWMDEGINSFVQHLTQEEFDNRYPSRRGAAWAMTDYMKLPKDQLEPIMTNSENIINFGSNAYGKPATALNILRETVMGRELFDYAFREYSRRWAFKHPEPADLFRTMEDASGEDLDWFWRGWFYGTDAVDISLDSVKYAKAQPGTPQQNANRPALQQLDKPAMVVEDISKIRNREAGISFETDADTSLRDFYWRYSRGLETYDTARYANPSAGFGNNTEALTTDEQAKYTGKHFYELHLSNKGGLVSPIIVEWTFRDGSKEIDQIPAWVWRYNENKVTKFFMKDKEVASIKLDPLQQTADIDQSNNNWGGTTSEPNRFQVFKTKQATRGYSNNVNPMQKATEKKDF